MRPAFDNISDNSTESISCDQYAIRSSWFYLIQFTMKSISSLKDSKPFPSVITGSSSRETMIQQSVYGLVILTIGNDSVL